MLLPGCGGRTDIDDWQTFYEDADKASGGVNGDSVGGAFGAGGRNSGGAFGAGGAFSTGGALSTGGTDSGGSAGVGGSASGGEGGTGGATSVAGEFFVDCETTIEGGDGFSWNTPLKHPALAIPELVNGDIIYLKAGTCHAWNSASEPLLLIPEGLAVTLAGGYDGNNLNDPFAHSGGKTILSGDNAGNDESLPGEPNADAGFAESRADNNRTILSTGANSDVLLTNLEVSGAYGSTASLGEACVTVGEGAQLTAVMTTLRNCSTLHSAALYAAPGSTIELSRVLVEHNHSAAGKGVISARQANVIIDDESVFRINRAQDGGALGLEASTLEVHQTEFIGNTATQRGGAIYLADAISSAEIEEVRFESNRALSGGAVDQVDGLSLIVSSEFTNNSSAYYGGSVFVEGGGFTLQACRFSGGSATVGGELSFRNTDEGLLSHNSFWDSSAFRGGAIDAENSAGLTLHDNRFLKATALLGCQVSSAGTPLTILDSMFFGGGSTGCGAIHATQQDGQSRELAIRTSSFLGFTSSNYASAVDATNTSVLMDANTFVENSATSSPVVSIHGGSGGAISRQVFRDNIGEGALSVNSANVYFADSYIGTHSSATSGALTLSDGATVTTRGLTFAENTANGASTPLLSVLGGSDLSLQNAVIWGSASATEPWFSVENNASVTVTTSCGPADLLSFGSSTTLALSPFSSSSPQFPLFQAATSPCLNQGSSVDGDYSTVSVVAPFSADTGAVDPGYHYAESTPTQGAFTANATEVAWDVDVDWCKLYVPSQGVEVSEDPSGTYEHSFPPGTDFWLVCIVSADAPPLVLKATP